MSASPGPARPVASPPRDEPRPSESLWGWLRETLRTGGPGQCIFAINNACNADCGFCNFALSKLPREDWRFVPLDGAKEAIEILHDNFVRFLVVTGGEPLLHPDVDEICRYASRRGLSVLLVTNGSRLTESRCHELADAGVANVILSIDAATTATHETNRHLPGVVEKIRRAIPILAARNVQVTASVTMSHLVDDYEALVDFVRDIGFHSVTFSYPLTDLASSFLGFASSPLVEFEREELCGHFEKIKDLKRGSSRFPILNPTASLDEMQRFLRNEEQRFECLGGSRYFYLDWELMVWRCHQWSEPMCHVRELAEDRYVRDGCTRCMIDCYRDSSVMQHVGMSVADAFADLRSGRPGSAAARLFRRTNAESIRSALENLSWIRGLSFQAAGRRQA